MKTKFFVIHGYQGWSCVEVWSCVIIRSCVIVTRTSPPHSRNHTYTINSAKRTDWMAYIACDRTSRNWTRSNDSIYRVESILAYRNVIVSRRSVGSEYEITNEGNNVSKHTAECTEMLKAREV